MKSKASEVPYLEQGRSGQKHRTRQRVLEAAAELISQGQSPTITDAADLAEVSRRTAYRYFSTQQQMLAEAALVIARKSISQIQLPKEAEERVDVTLRALQGFVYRNEAALRLLAQMYMLSPEQMEALRKAKDAEFDHLFLTGMIQHHKGALTMVDELFKTAGAGQTGDLFDFVTDVDSGQRAEIRIMESMLEKEGSKEK